MNVWGTELQIEKRRFMIKELEVELRGLNPRRKDERQRRDYINNSILRIRDKMAALRAEVKRIKEQRRGKRQK